MIDLFVGVHFKGAESESFLNLKKKLNVRSNSEACRIAVLRLSAQENNNISVSNDTIRKNASKSNQKD